ncbi:MAG TPA: hypothetical protein VGA77_06675 [Propylenella sp.]
MANRYRGEVAITIGERACTLVYDWQALATLRTEVGEDWTDRVAAIERTTDVDLLARVAAIGLKREWPECTAEQIMQASPPFGLLIVGVMKALTLSFWGERGPEADDGTRPPSRQASRETRSRQRDAQPAGPASLPPNSGG